MESLGKVDRKCASDPRLVSIEIESRSEVGRIGLWIGKNPKNPHIFGLDLDCKSIL